MEGFKKGQKTTYPLAQLSKVAPTKSKFKDSKLSGFLLKAVDFLSLEETSVNCFDCSYGGRLL
ncbi:hypothetical protein BSL78_06567 [Apostichopus japonicus]|uniref:Uncharacterized protein n=1 Tax=Stichopus japonicus TaxID=307972 RepID=A0A2G8L8A4_STIJA|nr:hypothetical protein BSL78_06567 [Apostichopus japonicus]